MSAILKNFKIKLSERQANEIRRQFNKACKEHGVDRASMLIQPKTQWCGCGSIGLLPPVLDVAVVSHECYHAVNKAVQECRDAEAVAKMRETRRQERKQNNRKEQHD